MSITVVGAFLMVGHLVSLPAPALAGTAPNLRLEATLAARPAADRGRWSATHVLYQACPCSSRVLDHLLDRRARPDVIETVAYVQKAPTTADDATSRHEVRDRVLGAGFRFETLTPSELEEKYQIESAPLLLVANPQGHVLYAAGYTDHSGGTQFNDVTIVESLQGGHTVRPLPIFGCAVSRRVQNAIDPLGLKY